MSLRTLVVGLGLVAGLAAGCASSADAGSDAPLTDEQLAIELGEVDALIIEARAEVTTGGYTEARRTITQAIDRLTARPKTQRGVHWKKLLLAAADTARDAEEPTAERRAREHLYAWFLEHLPANHPDVLAARLELAKTLERLGDTEGARVLRESVERAKQPAAVPAEAPGQAQPSGQAPQGNANALLQMRRMQEEALSEPDPERSTGFTGRAALGDSICRATPADAVAQAGPVSVGTPAVKLQDEAQIFYRIVARKGGDVPAAGDTERVLYAFVSRGEGVATAHINLGSPAAIEEAVDDWLNAIGARPPLLGAAPLDAQACGSRLRTLVLDPLLPVLEGVRHLRVVPEGALHCVPLDALPLDASQATTNGALVGDRWRISFSGTPEDPAPLEQAASSEGLFLAAGRVDRSAAVEVEQRARGPLGQRLVLDGRSASRDAVTANAPRARWLHFAAGGWSTPQPALSSNPSATSPTGTVQALQPAGASPLERCGLMFFDMNTNSVAAGPPPGLLTGDQLAALDLQRAELVVFTCPATSEGLVRRAGVGVANLRQAAHLAGARHVLAPLWSVSDSAAHALMLEFYRHLWVEGEAPEQALEAARRHLRAARDEANQPRFALRDWAGWVMTRKGW